MPKLLNLIVACAENRVIGRAGRLPWHIPEDARFLRQQTAGQICILGRVSYDTWPAVHADGRRPIVLTNHPLDSPPGTNRQHPGVTEAAVAAVNPHPGIAAGTLAEALAVADSLPGAVYICGGQRVYEEALRLDRPMRLHLTLVHAAPPGDTFLPEWQHLPWRTISRRESADSNFRYTFFTLERG